MKKLLNDKLNILRAMQGGVRDHRSTESTPKHVPAKELDTPKAIVEAAIEQGTCMYVKSSMAVTLITCWPKGFGPWQD